jgi:hypothetical protein
LAAQLAAQSREKVADTSAASREKVATIGAGSREKVANIHANASVKAANIRAEASKYGADKRSGALASKVLSGGDAGLPKGIATLLRPYASTVSEAHKEYMKARAAAAKRLGEEATGAAIDGDPNVRAAAAARDDATKAWNEASAPYMKKAQESVSNSAPVKVSSKAEFDKLPRGAKFIAPDGSVRTKP